MSGPSRINRVVLDNLVWFAGSLALAFFVWMVANFQSDPIEQRRLAEQIPVELVPDAGLLVTSPPSRNVSIVVRAPRSVLNLLTSDEIVVWADLSDLAPGEHAVELHASIARQRATVVDMSPRVLRVTLEESAQRQVPLRALITHEPPAGFSRDAPRFDVGLNQVLVSGPASLVDEVTAAQVLLDLSQQRNPFESAIRLVAVNADGVGVDSVQLDPQTVRVSVNIRRRDDVREVSVRPNIVGALPEGYVLNALSYAPQAVLVSGAPEQLAQVPDVLSTTPIDLTDQTTSFETTVAVLLPDGSLSLLADQTITVTVEINALTGSRQFDDVPVEVLGLVDGLRAILAPTQVSVLITGPQPTLDALTQADIRVTVDLNGVGLGNETATPTVTLAPGPITGATISVLPAEIDVEIVRDNTLNDVPR